MDVPRRGLPRRRVRLVFEMSALDIFRAWRENRSVPAFCEMCEARHEARISRCELSLEGDALLIVAVSYTVKCECYRWFHAKMLSQEERDLVRSKKFE